MFKKLFAALFNIKKRPSRIELRFVDYSEGDRLIREGWVLAPEEDDNHVHGMVFVEKVQ